MKRLALGLLGVLLLALGSGARIQEDPDRVYPTYSMSLQIHSLYLCPQERRWYLDSYPASCGSDTSQVVLVGRTVRHTPNAEQSLWYQREIVNYYIVR